MPDPPNRSLFVVIIAAMVLMVFAAYSPGISSGAPFLLDDDHVIVNRGEIRSPVRLGRIWSGTLLEEDYYRPLLYTGLVINLWLQGDLERKPGTPPSIVGLRLVNLLLHIGTWLLVFGVTLRLLEARRGRSSATTLAAGAVAVTGAVLPVCSQAVLYVSARSSLQMTFFALLSFRLYLAARLPRPRMLTEFQLASRYLAMILALVAAILTKEGAVVLPVVFLVFEVLRVRIATPLERDSKSGENTAPGQNDSGIPVSDVPEPALGGGFFAAAASLLPSFAVAGGLLALHAYFYFKIERPTGEMLSYSPWSYFLTQLTVIVRYVLLIVIPVNLSIHHIVPVTGAVSSGAAAAGIFLLLVLAGGVVLARWRPVYAFGIFWFFIALVPTSSVFPIWDAMFEHRIYFPAFGFLLAVILPVFYAIRSYEVRSSGKETVTSLVLPGMVFGLLACVLAVVTGARAADWRDEEKFWRATEKAEPKSYYAKSGLARLALERARKDTAGEAGSMGAQADAVKYFDEARKLWEDYLGEERWKRKLYIRAVVAYAESLRLAGRKSEAIKVLAEAEKEDRAERVPTVWFSKGKALRELAVAEKEEQKRRQLHLEAGAAFNSFLNKASGFGNREAHKLFLDTLLDLKNYAVGDNAALDALQRFPGDYEFLKTRAEILARLDRYREAAEIFQVVMRGGGFSDRQKLKMSYDFARLLNERKRYADAQSAVEHAYRYADIISRVGAATADTMQPVSLVLILDARIRNNLGEIDKVIELLNRAREINPRNPDIYDGLAEAYFRKNDTAKMKEAILDLLNVIGPGTDRPYRKQKRIASYRALAEIAARKSEFDEAINWMDRALEEDPGNEALKRRKEDMKKAAEAAKNPPPGNETGKPENGETGNRESESPPR